MERVNHRRLVLHPIRRNPGSKTDTTKTPKADSRLLQIDVDELLQNADLGNNAPGARLSKDRKIEIAKMIIERFTTQGVPFGIALAAVVNADVESGLNPEAGKGSNMVGLFQLTKTGGGREMTDAQLIDPEANIDRMIQEYEDGKNRTVEVDNSQGGKRIVEQSLSAALADNVDVSKLSGLFSLHIERPLAAIENFNERQEHANYLFPSLQGLPAIDLQSKKPGFKISVPSISNFEPEAYWKSRWPYALLGGPALGLFVVSLIALRRATRRRYPKSAFNSY